MTSLHLITLQYNLQNTWQQWEYPQSGQLFHYKAIKALTKTHNTLEFRKNTNLMLTTDGIAM